MTSCSLYEWVGYAGSPLAAGEPIWMEVVVSTRV